MRAKIAAISVYSMASMMALSMPASAQNYMTAGSLDENMSVEQKNAYLSGVVEGLAYARFLKDEKDETGMGCIYQWYYDGENTLPKILDAFDRYPDHTVGPILWSMSKQVCGE